MVRLFFEKRTKIWPAFAKKMEVQPPTPAYDAYDVKK